MPQRKYNPCPVPGCQRSRSITSKFAVCSVHDDLFEGITYYLNQAQKEVQAGQRQAQRSGARPGEKVSKGGIILPH